MYFAIYQMYKLLLKYHNLITTALKMSFSLWALYFLWQHRMIFKVYQNLPLNHLLELISILLILSSLNWFFEIKKWQILAHNLEHISLKEATKQSLISFSVSLLTPNRVGEYGSKIFFYDKRQRKKVLSLIFIGNTSQLIISLFMGVAALLYWSFGPLNKPLIIPYIKWGLLFLVMLPILFFLLRRYIKNPRKLIITQPKLWQKSLSYAGLRYFIFSSQFVLLLLLFSVPLRAPILYSAVFLTYFVSALIPMLAFLDWAVKGSVAIWIFSWLHISEQVIFKIIALMWTTNFLLPFLAGLILIWRYKIRLKK